MSQQRDSKYLTETAANAIGQYLRVKTPGACVVATATDPCIGVTQDPVLAAGPCTIGTKGVGTLKMTASEPITAGNPVYGAAAGKIAATGTIVEGTALEAAGADGDIIEVLPTPNTDISSAIAGTTNASFTVDSDSGAAKIKLDTAGATGNFTATIAAQNISGNITLTLPAATGTFATLAGTEALTNKTLTAPLQVAPNSAKTSGFAVTAALSGTTFTTKGAGGAVTFALPPATVGLKYRFYVGAAQELRLDPDNLETISLPSTGVAGAGGKYLTANAVGETIEIECCEAGTWAVFGYTGTWTSE